jgi:hypothetical protein
MEHAPEGGQFDEIPEFEHEYTSTACLHGLHDRCRKTCKFCAKRCACACHWPEADRANLIHVTTGHEPEEPEHVAMYRRYIEDNQQAIRAAIQELHRQGAVEAVYRNLGI